MLEHKKLGTNIPGGTVASLPKSEKTGFGSFYVLLNIVVIIINKVQIRLVLNREYIILGLITLRS